MGFWSQFLGFDPNRKRAFPGQQPGEEVVYMGVFHWITLVPFFLKVSVLVGILVGINVYGNFFEGSQMLRFYVNTTALTILIHLVGFRMYNYFLKVMLVTNHRMIDIRHTVVLVREREVIPLSNIQDFRYRQNGIIPRIFGYGDLLVLGSSSDVKYSFHYVPKVNRLHHLLGEIHRRAIEEYGTRRQRSLQAIEREVADPVLDD